MRTKKARRNKREVRIQRKICGNGKSYKVIKLRESPYPEFSFWGGLEECRPQASLPVIKMEEDSRHCYYCNERWCINSVPYSVLFFMWGSRITYKKKDSTHDIEIRECRKDKGKFFLIDAMRHKFKEEFVNMDRFKGNCCFCPSSNLELGNHTKDIRVFRCKNCKNYTIALSEKFYSELAEMPPMLKLMYEGFLKSIIGVGVYEFTDNFNYEYQVNKKTVYKLNLRKSDFLKELKKSK